MPSSEATAPWFETPEGREQSDLMRQKIREAKNAFLAVRLLLDEAADLAEELDTPENFEFDNSFRVARYNLVRMADDFAGYLSGWLPDGADFD